jgi:hypothetical protein
MIAARDLTPYCAAPGCDLNLAGWAHVPWDCDSTLPAPTLAAEAVAALPVERRPWVQGSARAFARLNPDLLAPQEPGEELPGDLATDPRQRARLREQEATATLGERGEAGLRAENASLDPERRQAAITDRAAIARLQAVDRDLLLASLARLPQGSPDLSRRSVTDRRFAAFLLSDHPAAVAERCRRRASYLDDTARRREVLYGWLAKLDAISPWPDESFYDNLRSLVGTTRVLLDRQATELAAEVGEPDQVRLARARDDYETQRQARGYRTWRYPARYQGPSAARQPIPPERPARAQVGKSSHRDRSSGQRRPGWEGGHER